VTHGFIKPRKIVVETDLGMFVGRKHIKNSTKIEERLATVGKAHGDDDGDRRIEDSVNSLS
jgi:hypothetical protein